MMDFARTGGDSFDTKSPEKLFDSANYKVVWKLVSGHTDSYCAKSPATIEFFAGRVSLRRGDLLNSLRRKKRLVWSATRHFETVESEGPLGQILPLPSLRWLDRA